MRNMISNISSAIAAMALQKSAVAGKVIEFPSLGLEYDFTLKQARRFHYDADGNKIIDGIVEDVEGYIDEQQ